MKSAGFYHALRWRLNAPYSVPQFDGLQSLNHVYKTLWSLKVGARLHRLRFAHEFDTMDLVQKRLSPAQILALAGQKAHEFKRPVASLRRCLSE